MKKELFLAVLIGLSLGLIITYGIYTARTSLLRPRSTDASASPATTPSPETSVVVLHSPEDESVVTVAELTIAGTTIPKTIVVIVVDDQDTITLADESGNFSTTVTLKPGANIVLVSQFDENGVETHLERIVTYLTNDFTAISATPAASLKPSPSVKPTASPKASIKPAASSSPSTTR